MRNEFAQSIIDAKKKEDSLVFLTGDLGYMALEKVAETFGKQFINAGIAEQNLITVAAGLAYQGFQPWCYSISPFVTLRPYEQIRNDVCLHNLPVKIVGNGGGFGYGIMGATHHNIEDIAAMRLLLNMRVYVPFLATDVQEAVLQMTLDKSPNYLRLNQGAKCNFPLAPFSQWRKIKEGNKAVVIGTGPVLENILNLPEEVTAELEIWVLSLFPFAKIPAELMDKIKSCQKIITIEEHQGQCGMHEALSSLVLQNSIERCALLPLYATGYISGKYGDQNFHQTENDLLGEGLLKKVNAFLK